MGKKSGRGIFLSDKILEPVSCQRKKPDEEDPEKKLCPVQRVIHSSFRMDPRRVKDRDLYIALVDEQRDLGTSKDNPLCSLLVRKTVDDPDVSARDSFRISSLTSSSNMTVLI